ncbi:hypothetical protein [Microcoleus sp. FACHB-831]|uniref:hypothetical protein n=1 Tax=Microcoleus sp. FACHB-831 TaxID=2692827 RepID=UPI001685A9E2|nr:hypothetical protein [Microcoleus sp. FACHB-831]
MVRTLRSHKTFLTVARDEYWSSERRPNVEAVLIFGCKSFYNTPTGTTVFATGSM